MVTGHHYFTIDAHAILLWGRESIKNSTTAVIELVKNCYDAGSSSVEIHIDNSVISILDNGTGMSYNEILENWLRIGFSNKRQEKVIHGRRRTGEKGVGRMSADRLGAKLELLTRTPKGECCILSVNWNDFEKPKTDLTSIPIQVEKIFNTDFSFRGNTENATGTQLIISDLRQTWTEAESFELKHELALLCAPSFGQQQFKIELHTPYWPDSDAAISSTFNDTAEISADFHLSKNTVTINTSTKSNDGKTSTSEFSSLSLSDFVHSKNRTNSSLGSVRVQLMFYPRNTETLRGTELALSDLRDFLDSYSGVRIYRDGIRVLPYGTPNSIDGDWLGLGPRKIRNPAGASRNSYRISPNQLVGSVSIGRDDNPMLVDTSSREGLIDNEAFLELKSFSLGCVAFLEAAYHTHFTTKSTEASEHPLEPVKNLGRELKSIRNELLLTKSNETNSRNKQIERVGDRLTSTLTKVAHIHQSISALDAQAVTYRGLATLGIATAAFGHEILSASTGLITSIQTAKALIKSKSSNLNLAQDEIEKALKSAKNISSWGAFALNRVRQDKRSKRSIEIAKFASDILDELIPAFTTANITLIKSLSSVTGKTLPMDLESIFMNLFSNAYFFCQLNSRERHIKVEVLPQKRLDRSGVFIAVSDSGDGVAPSLRNKVWSPMFSTKQDNKGQSNGTGLGLSIIDTILKEHGGEKKLTSDTQLLGARFEIWLPLE